MDTPSTIDPLKPPVLTPSGDELDEIEARIEAGELPPDYIVRHYAAAEANVFGFDHGKDAKGKPIEQGLGSPGNMTRQSIESYRKWGASELDYERHLARMEAQLAECAARRAAQTKSLPNKYGRR
jgi:hypothetical protein